MKALKLRIIVLVLCCSSLLGIYFFRAIQPKENHEPILKISQSTQLTMNEEYSEFNDYIWGEEHFDYYVNAPSGNINVKLSFTFYVSVDVTLRIASDAAFNQIIESKHEPNGGDIELSFTNDQATTIYIEIIIITDTPTTVYFNILVSDSAPLIIILITIGVIFAIILFGIFYYNLKIKPQKEKQVEKMIKFGPTGRVFYTGDPDLDLDTTYIKKSEFSRVELKRGIDFVGGLIRYKVAIRNNSPTSISNIEVSLQKMAEHIRVIDIQPRVYRKGDRAVIPNMGKQSESIDFYLEPLICGNVPVTPMITYLDAYGKPEMVSEKSLNINSKCPPIINTNEKNIARVKKIFEGKTIIKSFRTFELKHKPDEIFKVLIDSVNSWAGNQVSNPIVESENPFIVETLYFILNQNEDSKLGHREQIILKIRIDEKKGVGQIFVGAEKNPTVNGVLTHLWFLFDEKYKSQFNENLGSLHCPYCGNSVNYIDKLKILIECEFCQVKYERNELLT